MALSVKFVLGDTFSVTDEAREAPTHDAEPRLTPRLYRMAKELCKTIAGRNPTAEEAVELAKMAAEIDALLKQGKAAV